MGAEVQDSEVQGSAFMVEGLASPAAGGIREPRV